jgi:hypothetical protein
MKNKNKIIAILLSFFLPIIVLAASTDNGLIPSDTDIAKNGFGALAGLINNVIQWFLGISVSVAAITFSIAGANMLMHPNQPDEIKKAKEMFRKTVVGMLIVLGAWLIVHTIVKTLVTNEATKALRFLSN